MLQAAACEGGRCFFVPPQKDFDEPHSSKLLTLGIAGTSSTLLSLTRNFAQKWRKRAISYPRGA